MRTFDWIPAGGRGALLAASIVLAAPRAQAHGGETTPPAAVPPAAPGDGAAAQHLIQEIEARAAKDPETAKVVAEPVRQTKLALERAHGARVSGDAPHARLMDGLALEWAETARELERAAAAEQLAVTTARAARDAAAQVERARTLVEETQGRRERAAAELEKAEADAKDAARTAAAAEEDRLANAKKKGKGGKAPAAPAGPRAPAAKPPAAGKKAPQ